MKKLISIILISTFIFLIACTTDTNRGAYAPPPVETETSELQEKITELEAIIHDLENSLGQKDSLVYALRQRAIALEIEKQAIEQFRQELLDAEAYVFDHTWGDLGFIEIVEKEGELVLVIHYCARARINGYSLSNKEPHIRETTVVFAQEIDTAPLGLYQFNIFRYSPYSHGLTILIGSDLPLVVEESEFTELPVLNNRIEIPLGIRR